MSNRSYRTTGNASATECECRSIVADEPAIARARAAVSDDRLNASATALFAAFADPTRFRILEALSAGELCVCDLAALGSVSQSAVSHQLRLLRERGLVAFRREGNRIVYRLADGHVRTVLAQGLAHAREPRVVS